MLAHVSEQIAPAPTQIGRRKQRPIVHECLQHRTQELRVRHPFLCQARRVPNCGQELINAVRSFGDEETPFRVLSVDNYPCGRLLIDTFDQPTQRMDSAPFEAEMALCLLCGSRQLRLEYGTGHEEPRAGAPRTGRLTRQGRLRPVHLTSPDTRVPGPGLLDDACRRGRTDCHKGGICLFVTADPHVLLVVLRELYVSERATLRTLILLAVVFDQTEERGLP
jgi:hypothetical protein